MLRCESFNQPAVSDNIPPKTLSSCLLAIPVHKMINLWPFNLRSSQRVWERTINIYTSVTAHFVAKLCKAQWSNRQPFGLTMARRLPWNSKCSCVKYKQKMLVKTSTCGTCFYIETGCFQHSTIVLQTDAVHVLF